MGMWLVDKGCSSGMFRIRAVGARIVGEQRFVSGSWILSQRKYYRCSIRFEVVD